MCSRRKFNRIKNEFRYRCAHCNIPDHISKLTQDHIIPRSHGGTGHHTNIQPLCAPCNQRKGNSLPAQ